MKEVSPFPHPFPFKNLTNGWEFLKPALFMAPNGALFFSALERRFYKFRIGPRHCRAAPGGALFFWRYEIGSANQELEPGLSARAGCDIRLWRMSQHKKKEQRKLLCSFSFYACVPQAGAAGAFVFLLLASSTASGPPSPARGRHIERRNSLASLTLLGAEDIAIFKNLKPLVEVFEKGESARGVIFAVLQKWVYSASKNFIRSRE